MEKKTSVPELKYLPKTIPTGYVNEASDPDDYWQDPKLHEKVILNHMVNFYHEFGNLQYDM
jgi:hypothetical protein